MFDLVVNQCPVLHEVLFEFTSLQRYSFNISGCMMLKFAMLQISKQDGFVGVLSLHSFYFDVINKLPCYYETRPGLSSKNGFCLHHYINCSFLFSCWPPIVLMLVCEEAIYIWSSHKVTFNEREDSPQTKPLVDHKPSMADLRWKCMFFQSCLVSFLRFFL